ncbi:hypothetical protein GUJ93_ZPchr0008g13092 [Zizania palustris]|uniref:PIPK domain-containing protein n=1 Tax=Zizania palustris TaxID=103762 RepID=A0A8J5RJU8_ZIZPA|nr:hypothetical protein GUJ93_ZPchr0008g13092 [Zizania palustris]
MNSSDIMGSGISQRKHEGVSRDALCIDDHSAKSGDDSDGAESTNGKSSNMDSAFVENDRIWTPPEAADKEDEVGSVSANIAYDDDDYSDGIKWGKSSFPAAGEEQETSNNPREERENAMLYAMNGQLKILVNRKWTLDHTSSDVIKGLVSKKNAAHKHMPVSCHNPRLLLLKGVLGHSDVGLSSFNSMDQEKDHLERSISKMMEICSPNVILVEKTVSWDIQELLKEVLDKPKLKQCDSFHIEKIIEEHNSAIDGGKRLSKTLMFLEGFPRPLGCTILLRTPEAKLALPKYWESIRLSRRGMEKRCCFSRHVANSNDRDTFYLDQNYVEDMHVSPIYIGGRTKHLLQRAIWNDTSFLTSVNVMDYCLLVGVDKQKHELVFGIIDYLRQYTWDKQLETWVKASLVVPKNVSPTIISPKDYKKRFRKFIAKYFLALPDAWSPQNSSRPCNSFGHSNNMLVEVRNGDNLLQHPIEAEACVSLCTRLL